jgi:hypothetical protein
MKAVGRMVGLTVGKFVGAGVLAVGFGVGCRVILLFRSLREYL